MSLKMVFILLVIVLLVGCSDNDAADKNPGTGSGEGAGAAEDAGIDQVFGEDPSVAPPQAPN